MTVTWYGPGILGEVRQAVMRGVFRGAEGVKTEAIRLIESPPKTGRIYKRGGGFHQASAAGEAPATDLGNLVNSITAEFDFSKLSATVNASAEYAAALELSTPKIKERPFMRPALASRMKHIEADVSNEIRIVLEA